MLTGYRPENPISSMIGYFNDNRAFYEIASDVVMVLAHYLKNTHTYIIKKDTMDRYEIIIGYDADGNICDRFINKDNLKILSDSITYVTVTDTAFEEELKLLDCDGCVSVPVAVNSNLVFYLLVMDRKGHIFSDTDIEYIWDTAGILKELAQKKLFGRSAVATNSTLKAILSNVGSGVLVYDVANNNVLFRNSIAEDSEENIRVLMDATRTIMEDGLIPKRPVEFFDAESGLWFDVMFSKLIWMDGREVILISSVDTTLRKKNSTKSTFQAQNDFLTGLFNRMKCEADLKKTIEYSVKENKKGALLFIDLDNFKNINDSLGHDYGDALLTETAATLQGISGLRNHCYRMGGDEFVVIVTPDNYPILNRILTNISAAFNQPWYIIDSECYCTMSMGVVTFPDNGTGVNNLIKKADIAMYDAKKSGKNRYRFYKENSEQNNGYRRLEVESSMRQAVEASCEEFVVFYQPIVDAKTGRCTGCESLVRWDSKSLGFVGPGDFIPLAEYLGLIVDIGDFVLETACNQCRRWNEDYDPDFRINVNLSVVQLLQNNVVKHIGDIIKRTGVNPSNIILEITENLAINDMSRVTKIIEGLKETGVKIALDDFGTGYSSLNYIKQLNFDIIKIDKSFIDDITTDEYEKAFVQLIVGLSRQINVKLCAEGIETKEQYELLNSLNVDTIQGYYFGRPVPENEFEDKYFKAEKQ